MVNEYTLQDTMIEIVKAKVHVAVGSLFFWFKKHH